MENSNQTFPRFTATFFIVGKQFSINLLVQTLIAKLIEIFISLIGKKYEQQQFESISSNLINFIKNTMILIKTSAFLIKGSLILVKFIIKKLKNSL